MSPAPGRKGKRLARQRPSASQLANYQSMKWPTTDRHNGMTWASSRAPGHLSREVTTLIALAVPRRGARDGRSACETRFCTGILPAALKGAVRQDRPVVVIVGGQPGAGKTAVADLVQAALDRRGGAVRICSDLHKSAHCQYGELLADDVRTAGVMVRPDTHRWQAAVEDHVRMHGFDAVVESALADIEEFRTSGAAYRRASHRIEVVAVATPEALSQLGILDRFLSEAIAGCGRYVSWENHDACARKMLATLAAVEAERLADRITVVRRDGAVLYDNELVDGSWRRRPHGGPGGGVRALPALDRAGDSCRPS